MYERFSNRARKVMKLAGDEAKRLRHSYVGTEHILLGLAKEGLGVAVNVLKLLNVDPEKIRSAIESITQPEPADRVIIPKAVITPSANRVIENAYEEARHLKHNYVGTEHLLLGLLRTEDTLAATILSNMGLNLHQVRTEILNLLGHGTDAGNLPQAPEVRKAMAYANATAQKLRHPYIGTEHLLLGLLREPEGIAAEVLRKMNINIDEVRAEVLRVLGGGMDP